PPNIPFSQCLALHYLQAIGNVLFRESLSAFLLWRLRQIHYDRRDQWISIILFTIKTALTVPILALQRVSIVYDPVAKLPVCYHDRDPAERYIEWSSIITDFIIDIYVT
ncbi:18196_t:CDS:2, partial [Racocetra persica]